MKLFLDEKIVDEVEEAGTDINLEIGKGAGLVGAAAVTVSASSASHIKDIMSALSSAKASTAKERDEGGVANGAAANSAGGSQCGDGERRCVNTRHNMHAQHLQTIYYL